MTALNLRLDRVARLAIDRLIIEIAGWIGPATTPAPAPALIVRPSTIGA